MKRHLITAAIWVVALVLYLLGITGWGLAFFVAGAVFELLFWVRLVSSSTPTPGCETSNTD